MNQIATVAQQSYLQILFDDLGFTQISRNLWLTQRFGRDIRYLDSLSLMEASKCISELKERKEWSKATVPAGEEESE